LNIVERRLERGLYDPGKGSGKKEFGRGIRHEPLFKGRLSLGACEVFENLTVQEGIEKGWENMGKFFGRLKTTPTEY